VESGRQAEDVGGIKFLVSTRIDTRGQSSRRRIVQKSPGYWGAAGRAARSLDDVRYIPAFNLARASWSWVSWIPEAIE